MPPERKIRGLLWYSSFRWCFINNLLPLKVLLRRQSAPNAAPFSEVVRQRKPRREPAKKNAHLLASFSSRALRYLSPRDVAEAQSRRCWFHFFYFLFILLDNYCFIVISLKVITMIFQAPHKMNKMSVWYWYYEEDDTIYWKRASW